MGHDRNLRWIGETIEEGERRPLSSTKDETEVVQTHRGTYEITYANDGGITIKLSRPSSVTARSR